MHVNDLASAREHLERSVAMYEAQGESVQHHHPRSTWPFLSLAAGRPEEARAQVLEILEFYRSTARGEPTFSIFTDARCHRHARGRLGSRRPGAR
jgi:hypothetical protein